MGKAQEDLVISMARILLIDDEELVIQSVEKFLGTQGYEVISARSGHEAIEQVKRWDFDLIITDIRMPDLNGITALSRIREVLTEKGSPRIPEICITGYADDEMIKKAETLEVSDFLYKPFDLADFLSRIKRVLKPHPMEYFSYLQKAFVYKYVVMLTDADQFKHMSFANYLKLMFLATDALLMPCVDSNFLSKTRLKLITSRMQFKKQTVAGDTILVKVNPSEINFAGFSLLYTFVIEGSAELVSLGRQSYALVNLEKNCPEPIPDQMEKILVPIRVAENSLVYKY